MRKLQQLVAVIQIDREPVDRSVVFDLVFACLAHQLPGSVVDTGLKAPDFGLGIIKYGRLPGFAFLIEQRDGLAVKDAPFLVRFCDKLHGFFPHHFMGIGAQAIGDSCGGVGLGTQRQRH